MTSTDTYDSQADELLSIGDTARQLGVSVATIRRWESDGKISGSRTAGGQRRFPRSEISRLRMPPA
ncbi:MerR family transcriptional regulator [Nocardioides alkalitolerans]|uniref:MerR family transcriptional regulator n=1 Tax=Nocardioides alkalitolerans TaxID=281714 RepID=UPI000490824D|nr:helix-turn-helix domain-containing protein [Nocardioides alkalitolerans]